MLNHSTLPAVDSVAKGPHDRLVCNNFDLIRLLLASTVFLAHVVVLTGQPVLAPLMGMLSSTVAVQAFFVVSGFLIFMSYERTPTLRSYLEKRARRLLPAYVTVVMLCAVGLAWVSDAPTYFNEQWLKYVGANLVFLNFLQPTLPGVFDGQPVQAVNGSLWTLKIEVMFYLSVPAFAWLIARLSPAPVIVTTYVLSLAYAAHVPGELGRQLPGQLSYFMAGAACYYGLAWLEREVLWIAPLAVVAFFAGGPWLQPAALGVLVCVAALWCYLGPFGRYGDFSYGVYIVHFPVLQLFVKLGLFEASPWGALLGSIAVVLALAVLLWHGVEAPALGRRRGHATAGRFGAHTAQRVP